jgi:8-amino-7-oxononanoate synthase
MSDSTQTPVDVFEKARTHDRAEQLEAAKQGDLLPYFRILESQAGPVVEMEGRETIMLGSNNYLGLTTDERVKQAARDALEQFGTGVTGSRLLNGTTPLHMDLERELADWMGTEDAIVFTTGYQATTLRSSTAASSQALACAPSGTTGWTSSRRCSSGPLPMAAELSSWSTASSPWRATSATCRRSSSSVAASARG